MKLPNNYGSVSKLSGNRRRPYMVRKSLDGNQLVIGYFETKEKALQALADYNRQPASKINYYFNNAIQAMAAASRSNAF